jgi:hypothetical protein
MAQRSELSVLLGEKVTVTNPANDCSWNGILNGWFNEPVICLLLEDGKEIPLPQRFRIEPAGRDPRVTTSPVHWAPYQEFGFPDPALETAEPPAVPVLVKATSYRREQGTEQVIIYWLEGTS